MVRSGRTADRRRPPRSSNPIGRARSVGLLATGRDRDAGRRRGADRVSARRTGSREAVPWATAAERIVVVWQAGGEYHAADVDVDAARDHARQQHDRRTARHGERRPRGPAGRPVAPALIAQLRLKSALARSIQVCAALDRILAALRRARDLACPVRSPAVEVPGDAEPDRPTSPPRPRSPGRRPRPRSPPAVASEWSASNLEFLVAVARSCAGHAASVVVRNAHQVHGAIGTTREHRLHEFTRCRAGMAFGVRFGSVLG